MKKKMFLSKVLTAAFLLAAVCFVLVNQTFTQETEKSAQNRPNPTGDGTAPAAPAGYVSGVFSLLPGQSVRVAAVNSGNKAIPLEIVFVPLSEQGKAGVSVLCDATPAPGDSAVEKYTIPDGTSNRRLMYVQIRVEQANNLKNIAPSLEVFSEQPNGAGGPHFFLGGNGFIEIRPIFVPS